MTKGGFELVFKRVHLIWAFLLQSYNSRSSDDFAGSSCKLKLYGGLILLLFLLHYCTHAELHQSPYFIMHFKFFILYVKCVYELQDIGVISMILLFKCALLQKQIPHYAHLQGEFFYILQSNSSTSVFTLHMFIPVENLTYIVINHQKGGDCKCI